jgi:hypothetical protein
MTARGRFRSGFLISSATLVIWTKPRYETKISPVVVSMGPYPLPAGRFPRSDYSAPTIVKTARIATMTFWRRRVSFAPT